MYPSSVRSNTMMRVAPRGHDRDPGVGIEVLDLLDVHPGRGTPLREVVEQEVVGLPPELLGDVVPELRQRIRQRLRVVVDLRIAR